MHDQFYKRGYDNRIGTFLRKSYEVGRIKKAEDFKEVLANVLSNSEKI